MVGVAVKGIMAGYTSTYLIGSKLINSFLVVSLIAVVIWVVEFDRVVNVDDSSVDVMRVVNIVVEIAEIAVEFKSEFEMSSNIWYADTTGIKRKQVILISE